MSSGPVKPVYVLRGSDLFRRDQHRGEIIARLVGDADPAMCVTTFDAAAELAAVLDELRTLPFLAPLRIVVIFDADAFVSAYREQIEKYLNAPSASGVLILAVSSWPSNTRLAKLTARIGEIRDCSTPDPGDLPGWVADALAKQDLAIQPDAAELMAQWVGADLATLANEVEKLAIYVQGRKTVTPDDVAALVAATAGPQAFALTNAITAGDVPGALKALAGTVVRRGDEIKTLGMIGWHLRRCLQAQRDLAQGGRISFRLPYQAQQAMTTMLRRRGRRKLQEDFRRLIRCDLALKSGAEPGPVMQELVAALCS